MKDHPRPLAHQRDELPADNGEVFNFIMAFLFRELRDSVGVKRFFHRMFNHEFTWMKNNTALGKILERVTVLEIAFGTSLPVVEKACIVRPEEGDIGDENALDVDFDLKYTGRFNITVRADLAFGKTAKVSCPAAC